MGGISFIIKQEAHQKKLEKLEKLKGQIIDGYCDSTIYKYFDEEKKAYLLKIRENYLLNHMLPEAVEIEDFDNIT